LPFTRGTVRIGKDEHVRNAIAYISEPKKKREREVYQTRIQELTGHGLTISSSSASYL